MLTAIGKMPHRRILAGVKPQRVWFAASRARLAVAALGLACVACFVPLLLLTAGAPLQSSSMTMVEQLQRTERTADLTADDVLGAVRGVMVHTVLEWTSFSFSFATFFTAPLHMFASGDVVTAFYCIALFGAGVMDCVHTLVSGGLLASQPDPDYIPFTWAMARIFKSVMVLCASLLVMAIRWRRVNIEAAGSRSKACLAAVFGVTVAVLIGVLNYLMSRADLPTTQFPDSTITRPYDVLPMVVFLVNIPLLWLCRPRDEHSVFIYGVLVGNVFDIATQGYMAFGSSALFDSHFNIAHFMKVWSFLLPWSALMVDVVVALSWRNQALVEAGVAAHKQMVEYIALTTHDLRTPMNGIVGALDLLEEECELPPAGTECVGMISDGVDMLRHTVENILLYTKVIRGQELVPVMEEFNPHTELEACTRLLSTSFREGVEVRVEAAPGARCTLLGPRQWLRQMAVNLLGNAAKFTFSGSVTVVLTVAITPVADEAQRAAAASMAPVRGDRVVLGMDVVDTGPGISDEDKQRLFRAFAQLDHNQGGTGLGLFSVAKQSAALGGSVHVGDNPDGHGAVFGVELPMTFTSAACAADEKSLAPPPRRGKPAKRAAHLDVLAAARRLQSLRRARSLPVSLSDKVPASAPLALPTSAGASSGDGPLDMRARHGDARQEADLAQSVEGLATRHGSQAGRGAGGAGAGGGSGEGTPVQHPHVTSGVGAGSAVDKVAHAGDSSTTHDTSCADGSVGDGAVVVVVDTHSTRPPFPMPDGKSFTALAVDDVAGNRKLLVKFLQKAGGEVATACDGVEALEAMQRNSFDIVLCDIQMPRMDGFECVRQFRQWEAVNVDGVRQSVVAFTAMADPAADGRCREAGMDDVLTKPLKRKTLNAMLAKFEIPMR